ncbi:MAG TPA: hydrogen peroxide-inducible genes activator [Burkholderiales bacterium]|nr:hydrogen peroxide-inducible genes activator [Burkholderiales bacterium]
MSALPSLRQLGYFVEVADRLNFRAAAEASFVTQSTLSAGIKELESLLGVELVERDPRGVRLTPAGEEVARRARTVLAAAQDLVDSARGAGEPLDGVFRMGVIPTVAPFLLSGVMAGLRNEYPGLKLHLREDLTERLLERLRAGELDAALIALPYDTGELKVTELFEDEFWFVAPEDDAHAGKKEMLVRDIEPGSVVLLEEGHCLRDHAIAACGTRGPKAKAVLEATSLTTLIQMVEGGLGVTLLPELTLKAGILKGTHLVARPFSGKVPSRTVALVSRPAGARRADVELLAAFFQHHYRAQSKVRAASRHRTGPG